MPDLLIKIYPTIMPEPAVIASSATEVRVRSMSDLGPRNHPGVGYASIAHPHVVNRHFHIIPGLEYIRIVIDVLVILIVDIHAHVTRACTSCLKDTLAVDGV